MYLLIKQQHIITTTACVACWLVGRTTPISEQVCGCVCVLQRNTMVRAHTMHIQRCTHCNVFPPGIPNCGRMSSNWSASLYGPLSPPSCCHHWHTAKQHQSQKTYMHNCNQACCKANSLSQRKPWSTLQGIPARKGIM